jgi:4-hydroxythreonine-4-phosphate dehydrogenase
MNTTLPLLALTMGDPAGIGPEIVVKALRDPRVGQICRPLVIGDRRILARAADWCGGGPPFADVSDPALLPAAGQIAVLDRCNAAPHDCPPGQISACAGAAAVDYVVTACDLALGGQVAGIVTAPLNKAAMHAAGHHYAGHTELLAERTGATAVGMLLVSPQLRVVHVSTHVALAEAIARVRRDRVLATIALAHESCQALGIARPRIAVAGLNPHAGEGGLFGDHEAREIAPAVAQARARGWDVSDPQPPDTVFLRASRGTWDIVVAMYHDQGHIPMKVLAFDEGVNVSVGLPIVRTSVDHGTAFDIAGRGTASERSMLAAITVAVQLVRARQAPAGR